MLLSISHRPIAALTPSMIGRSNRLLSGSTMLVIPAQPSTIASHSVDLRLASISTDIRSIEAAGSAYNSNTGMLVARTSAHRPAMPCSTMFCSMTGTDIGSVVITVNLRPDSMAA
jgi:hypothetical protein